MGNKLHAASFLVVLALLCFQSVLLTAKSPLDHKIYIVYLGEGERKHEDPEELVTGSQLRMLTSVIGSKEEAISSIVDGYGFSSFFGLSGFAAKLSESQAQKIEELPEVLCVMPLTRRSWVSLSVDNSQLSSLLSSANYDEDIIVGVIDSGVWPEAKNFNDESNRKLIDAQYYKDGVITELQKGDYLSQPHSRFYCTRITFD